MGILQKVVEFLNQSGADWIPMSQALDDNIITVTMLLIAYCLLSLSFYSVIILLACSIKNKGFFNADHKKLSVWFLVFLFLVGTSYSAEIVTMFYPFYWIYAGILLTAGTSAFLTVVIYIKHFNALSKIPSGEEMERLQNENKTLREKEILLKEHLELSTAKTTIQIADLRKEHQNIAEELRASTNLDVKHFGGRDEDIRERTLDALTKVNKELETLTEVLK